ncbi:MAG: RNA 2',3'-cyclic phosphodiesterase [Gemmatimonadales bacterium]
MRLFAAIPVAPPALGEIGRLLEQLRARDWPVKWVREEGLHLTLKFFGEVAAERAGEIATALGAAAAGTPVLDLGLSGIGVFPNPRRPRVLWVGLEGPVALELLADRVERQCQAIGFPVDGKPFQPHVTLGRLREGGRVSSAALTELGHHRFESGFAADSLVLYESRPGSGGTTYLPHSRFDLTH